MTTECIAGFLMVLVLIGFATSVIASQAGPRATLAAGLGEVLLAAMLGAISATTNTPAFGAAALAVVVVGVLAIFAVAMNRWLPKP